MTAVWIVLAGVLATQLTRYFAFIFMPSEHKNHPIVTYFSRVLPYATMGMLVVYVLKDIQLQTTPYGLPEIIAVGATVLIHRLLKNSLVTIGLGTAVYLVIIHLIV